MLKVSGILAMVAGMVALIAFFLPAAYFHQVYTASGIGWSGEAEITLLYWFFGFWYASIRATYESDYGGSSSYSDTATGFAIDPVGMACAIILLVGGVTAIVMGSQVTSEKINPKIGGGIILLMGLLTIVFIAAFVVLIRDITIIYGSQEWTGTFQEIFPNIGPGVFVGLIAGIVQLVSGILSLIFKE